MAERNSIGEGGANSQRAHSPTPGSNSHRSDPAADSHAVELGTNSLRAVNLAPGANPQPRDAAAELRDAAVDRLQATADQLGTVGQQGGVAAVADHLGTVGQQGGVAAVADQLGTVGQHGGVAAAAEQLRAAAAAEQLRAAAAAAEQLRVAAAAVEHLRAAAAAADQLRAAAADQLGNVAQQGRVAAAAEQLRAAAGRLETAADRPADIPPEQRERTVVRLCEAANDVRIVRLGSTALTTADFADREEFELYLTEKKLQDTTNKFLNRPANNNSGVVDFEEITNLVIIERYPKLKKALDLWYQRDKDLKAKIAQKEARRSDVRNQIYNIIGWYGVYLGVVLTAVSQLTQDSQDPSGRLCRKAWFPIVLTAVGFLATVGGLYVKFGDLSSLESTILDETPYSLV